MRSKHLTLGVAVALAACTVQAQQNMQDMTGMPMPNAPAPQPKQATKPNKAPSRPDPKAPDIQGMQGNARAQSAAASERNSVAQQKAQAGVKPNDGSDATSVSVPVQEMQEPEAPAFRTGGDLPVPELLGDVVGRTPMRVEDFLALADKNNPTLAEAQRDIDRSNQQARQMGLPPDPVLGYSGDHIRGGSYHGGEEGAFFSQVFVLGRKLALRRDIYRAEGRANQYALEVQRARVHNDVATAFVDAMAAQEMAVVRDRLLKVALDADTNSHELQRVGQADASAVLTAEIAAEQAKIDFQDAQRMYLAAFGRLRALAGQADLPVAPLTGELVAPPALDTHAVVERDAAESPMVQQAQAGVQIAEARLRDAKRERVPNLNVTAGEWYSGEELDSVPAKKTGWMSFAQAGVQIPLWNHNQGNIGAAQAELDRANKDVTRTQLWTRHRAEPIAQEYERNRFTAERYRTEMIPRARRAYQLEVTKYQQMAQDYPAVLTAQRLLFSLQMSYVQALAGEWDAAIALENYTLMNGLEMPVAVGSDTTTMNTPTGRD